MSWTDPVLPLKGWRLHTIWHAPGHCAFCGTAIQWQFQLIHDKTGRQTFCVGSECVKSLTDTEHAEEALHFAQRAWRQRRHYFFKKIGGLTYIVGEKPTGWWAAMAPSLDEDWVFARRSFTSLWAAEQYIEQFILGAK